MSDDTKQRLSDTFLTFLPKNTAGYTYQNQLIEVQIPKSEHVINLAKAMIYLSIRIPIKINEPYVIPDNHERFFVGAINSATIFDQVQIHSNNKAIYTDSLCQVNSRIWQLSKPSKYLDANYHSFINIKDVRKNNRFIVQEIFSGSFSSTNTYYYINLDMKIPLPCLFNCFDNVEAFSTTVLNDNVSLMMQLSPLEKYLCLFITDNNGKLLQVKPFGTDNSVELFNNIKLICSSEESHNYRLKDGFRIVVPGHYPTEEEKIEINNVIANGGWFRPYINTRIDAKDVSFGPSNKGNTIQSAINFSTDVHNLYNVIMLSAHEHSHVVYDKPKISDIEVNASELWKLANNGTHVDPTYDGDTDMYQDLLNGFGTQTFKNLERFDDSITHDYLTKYIDKSDLTVLAARIIFKLTISLNNTNNGFDNKTNASSENYTPVTFEILDKTIVTKKYEDFSTKILEDYEIDKTNHTKSILVMCYVNNSPAASQDFTNRTFNFQCDNSVTATPFNFTIQSPVTGTEKTKDITSGRDIEAKEPTSGSDTTLKRLISVTIGFKHIRPSALSDGIADDKLYGSYLQFYKFSPTNQLGYSADYFTSLINYKFKNNYSAYQTELAGSKYNFNLTQNNYDSSTMFCCCQSLSFLVFKEGGIDIVNPYSEDLDVRFQMNNMNSYCGNGHGLGSFVPGLFSPITTLCCLYI